LASRISRKTRARPIQQYPLIADPDPEGRARFVVSEPIDIALYDDLALTRRQIEGCPEDRHHGRGVETVLAVLPSAFEGISQ
jgi:hypothetical protein